MTLVKVKFYDVKLFLTSLICLFGTIEGVVFSWILKKEVNYLAWLDFK